MRYLTLILCLALTSALCYAEKEPPATVTITGELSAVHGPQATLSTYTLTTDDGQIYSLQVDAEQHTALNPLLGIDVHVTGTIHTNGTQKWLTVISFSVAESDDGIYHTMVMSAPRAH